MRTDVRILAQRTEAGGETTRFSGGFGEDRVGEQRALRVRIEDMHHNALHHASGATEGRVRNEPELQQLIVQALRASGIAVEEQVVCRAGAADIVTARRDAVIEVKLELTRKAVQWAVGQVLLYRAAINPDARAIVVGYATAETAALINWAAAVGVEVICWNADGGKLKSELSALSVPFFSLQWNIQALAHSHGVTRVADLARLLGLRRQGLYGVWRGTAVNISVARLERFAQRLGPTPNEWLRPDGCRADWHALAHRDARSH